MKIDDLNSTAKNKYLVILPGGYHPFHPGHYSVYEYLKNEFPGADVYVASGNDSSKRPFNFAQKKFLAMQAGIPSDKFIEVASPYKSNEITKNYDPTKTILIFALSKKDAGRLATHRKDGTLGYLQPLEFSAKPLKPMDQQGYFVETPVANFSIGGEDMNSATKIREKYINSTPQQRIAIAQELYPHSKQIKKVVQVLNAALLKPTNTVTESLDHPKNILKDYVKLTC